MVTDRLDKKSVKKTILTATAVIGTMRYFLWDSCREYQQRSRRN